MLLFVFWGFVCLFVRLFVCFCVCLAFAGLILFHKAAFCKYNLCSFFLSFSTKACTFSGVHVLCITGMPVDSRRRWFRSLFLRPLLYVWRLSSAVTSLWRLSALGLILFQIIVIIIIIITAVVVTYRVCNLMSAVYVSWCVLRSGAQSSFAVRPSRRP